MVIESSDASTTSPATSPTKATLPSASPDPKGLKYPNMGYVELMVLLVWGKDSVFRYLDP